MSDEQGGFSWRGIGPRGRSPAETHVTQAGYYEPHARLALDRPVVLMGHPGSGVAAVGRVLCARTGLPFNQIERLVEAAAGRSRSRVVIEDGAERLHQLEWAALCTAVRRRPPGIVTTDAACFGAPDATPWLRQRALLVHVQRPGAYLLRRIHAEIAAEPGSLPDFVFAAPESSEELALHLAARDTAFSAAHVIIDAGETHPLAVAAELLETLDELVGTRPGA